MEIYIPKWVILILWPYFFVAGIRDLIELSTAFLEWTQKGPKQ